MHGLGELVETLLKVAKFLVVAGIPLAFGLGILVGWVIWS